MDLSDLLSKLTALSGDRSGSRIEGSFQLRGEEMARLAKLLDVDISRISELLGKDITRLAKLVGENMRTNARVNHGKARSEGFSATDETAPGGKWSKGSRGSDEPQEKRVKGPKAQRKQKRVRGPKAQRISKNR